jgi:cytochrome b6-f complex iron-sulfur subunit
MPEEKASSSRREFLTFIKSLAIVGGAGALLAPLISYFWPAKLEQVPSEPVPVGSLDAIPVGGAKTIRYGRYPALIIHTPEGVRAYSAVCTHFACICKWNPETGRIECPCHDGFFSPLDGSVLSGPPPEPLNPIPTYIEAGTLFLGGEA